MSDLTFKELAALAFALAGSSIPECIAKADLLAEKFCEKHGHTGQQPAHFIRSGHGEVPVLAKPCTRCGEELKDPHAHMATAPTHPR
ncbi:MAG TPA: hypothetical protein VFA98_11690 [Thermoanaerobaculia bacterium]|nr:hypothetical protein [Thermoanaerobaculia bacterium]